MAKSGDTLDLLARRYNTSVAAIKQANGLSTIDIKQNRAYRIPVETKAVEAERRLGPNPKSKKLPGLRSSG